MVDRVLSPVLAQGTTGMGSLTDPYGQARKAGPTRQNGNDNKNGLYMLIHAKHV